MPRIWRLLLVCALGVGLVGCAQFSATKSRLWGSAPKSKPDQTAPATAATTPAPEPEVPESSAEISPHDSATQLLIATELRDASPEERERWHKRLNTLPSSQVAMALRERRAWTSPVGTEVAQAAGPVESEPQVEQTSGQASSDWNALDFNKFKGRLGLPQIMPDRESSPPVNTPPATTAGSPLPSTEPQPISPGQSLWEAEVRKLMALLETDTHVAHGTEDQDYLKRQVAIRMLALLADDPQAATRVIPHLPASEQEFWSATFQGLAHCLNEEEAHVESRRALALSDLRSAIHHLQAMSPLELANASFSRRIDGFGNLERFPQDSFAGGESVLVYVELRNFHSEPQPGGGFESRVRSTAELVRVGEDAVVDQKDFGTTLDHCQVKRTDYFLSFRLDLPPVSPGEYQLRLKVHDEMSGKTATSTLPLSIR